MLKKFDCENETDLAVALGYSPAGLAQLANREVTERSLAEMVKKASSSAIERAVLIEPIVEFFPLSEDGDLVGGNSEDQKRLRILLSEARGIYSFYNSELEVIYVGKTVKSNLLNEARQAYARPMKHYKRYQVSHPREKFAQTTAGFVRKIEPRPHTLSDAAQYFSAYSLHEDIISSFETLLIRMIPNDLLNVRMEGNTSLRFYSKKHPT